MPPEPLLTARAGGTTTLPLLFRSFPSAISSRSTRTAHHSPPGTFEKTSKLRETLTAALKKHKTNDEMLAKLGA